jgi:hypothetical protein
MVPGWQIVGSVSPLAQLPAWDPRLLWATLALAGAVLVGAAIITLLDRWRKRAGQIEECTANDQLAQFRLLYEQGALSKEEFERIRATLTERLREEMDVPAEAPPAAAPPVVPPPAGAQPPALEPPPSSAAGNGQA